jgi:hypothetical protein
MQVLLFLGLAWAAVPADLDPALTPSVDQREEAVTRIGRHPDATHTLIEVLRADPAIEVRALAASALFARWASGAGDSATYLKVAIWAAENADDPIRAAAVRALGELADDYSLVVRYLEDEDPAVQAAAYAACEQWAARHPNRARAVRARTRR